MRPVKLLWCLLLLPAVGCNTPQSTLDGHGPAASRIASLSWWMTIVFLVVTVLMWLLIAWGFLKRRGKLEEHAPISADGGQIWIAIGGLVVPFVVLTVFFVFGLSLLAKFPIHGMPVNSGVAMQDMRPEIRITGHQWWWQIDYLNSEPALEFTTANELHLPLGRSVNIEVITADVMHSLWIPQLHGKVDLIPGVPNYIHIDASKAGTYQGQCAEFCGGPHAQMRILAVVQPPDEYRAWLLAQRSPASEPKMADEMAGEQVFMSGPCALCHQIRGTLAGGRVAPDLTHIGSRLYIAANSFPNNNAYLEAWVTHAQSLKPEAQMPDLAQFTGTQLQDLIAYLRQLQ
jgi:cytochrome c oxidase subunit II